MALFNIKSPNKKKEHTYSYYLVNYNESGTLKSYVIVKDGKEIFHSNGYPTDEAIEKAKEYIMENN